MSLLKHKKVPCKLCLENKKLIKAHIIPEAFFRSMYSKDSTVPLEVISDWDEHPKKNRIGIYDSEILCADCDNFLGKLDNYGKSLLLDGNFSQMTPEKQAFILTGNAVQYSKLKLFVLSILWRASISGRREFSRINLGSHEQKIREMIIHAKAGSPEEYSVVIGKWGDGELDQISRNIIQTPHSTKFDQINYCTLYLSNGIILYIKVDKRPTPNNFEKILIKPDSDIYVVNRGDFTESKEFMSFTGLVKSKKKYK